MDKLNWTPRKEPLSPLGLMVDKEQWAVAKPILLNIDDGRLSQLRGSYCKHVLIILGVENDLPWLPGGVYIGQESLAPHLFMPTLLKPSIPIDLLDRAIGREFGEGQFLVNPWFRQVYNLTKALTLSKACLEPFPW